MAETERDKLEAWEKTLGALVREHRLARGMSQAELAELMRDRGFSSILQTTIAKIEAGARPLRVSELVGVANSFGLPWQSMLTPFSIVEDDDPISELEAKLASEQDYEDITLESFLDTVKVAAKQYADVRARRETLALEIRRRVEGKTGESSA